MPIGDNASKGPRGKYDNVILPKEELKKLLEEQRSLAPAAIERVSQRLRDQRDASEAREKQRRYDRKKDKDATRGANKTDFYDKL